IRRQLLGVATEVVHIVPELREVLPDLPDALPGDSEAARFRLFDATARFLTVAATERPIVIVLDDLHAADEPSLLLLRYVASVLADTRILLIGTFRDVDPTVGALLEATLADLAREAVTRRIHLSGLTEPEVGRLAELTAGQLPNERMVRELHTETA